MKQHKLKPVESSENLGLDADGSSDDRIRYDQDSERVSHNPDGEDDDRDTKEQQGYSPLMNK